MGSFNVSCFASHRTISVGETAYILPIYQTGNFEKIAMEKNGLHVVAHGSLQSSCYPESFWGYVGPVFEGTYEDYGNFSLKNTSQNKKSLISYFDYLLTSLFNVFSSGNSLFDDAFNFSTIYQKDQNYSFEQLSQIWAKLWEVGQSNKLFLQVNDAIRPMTFTVLHEKTVAYFKKYAKAYQQDERTFESCLEYGIRRHTALLIKQLQGSKQFPDMKHIYQEGAELFANKIAELQDVYLGANMQPLCGQNTDSVLRIVRKYLNSNPSASDIDQDTIQRLKRALAPSVKLKMINMALSHLNIRVEPSTYAGQDVDNGLGTTYAKFIRAINR